MLQKLELLNIQSWGLSLSVYATSLNVSLWHRKVLVPAAAKEINDGTFEHHFRRKVCSYADRRVKLGS